MVGLAGATGREYGTGTDSCPTLDWGRWFAVSPRSQGRQFLGVSLNLMRILLSLLTFKKTGASYGYWTLSF